MVKILVLSQQREKRLLPSSCLSVCPFVRLEQFDSHSKHFREIWYLCIFSEFHRENVSFTVT